MSLEHVRVSEQGRAQLIKLKRHTNIQHWNTLCRWAFCLSLAEQSPPAPAKVPADSNVEMSWKTFGGPFAEVYLALLKERLRRDGLEVTDENLTTQFRLHLHRGIGYLSADRKMKNITGIFRHLNLTS